MYFTSLALAFLLVGQQPQPERLCSGSRPRVSPDGRWVALHRFVAIPGEFGFHGEQIYRTEVWIRDLRTGEEKLLSKASWLSGWINSTREVFHDAKSAVVPGAPDTGKVSKPPDGITAQNKAWAPGGARIAYF